MNLSSLLNIDGNHVQQSSKRTMCRGMNKQAVVLTHYFLDFENKDALNECPQDAAVLFDYYVFFKGIFYFLLMGLYYFLKFIFSDEFCFFCVDEDSQEVVVLEMKSCFIPFQRPQSHLKNPLPSFGSLLPTPHKCITNNTSPSQEDTDPRVLEKQELQQPTYVALSYIN
ncbi:hypothetical protein STEG23_010844, partial [Scotinomys teguina]